MADPEILGACPDLALHDLKVGGECVGKSVAVAEA